MSYFYSILKIHPKSSGPEGYVVCNTHSCEQKVIQKAEQRGYVVEPLIDSNRVLIDANTFLEVFCNE